MSNRIPLPRSGVVKGFAVGVIVGTVVVASAAVAKADGHLDASEVDYANTYHQAVCITLDSVHSVAGVLGVARGIIADGFDVDSAADIINASVKAYCPRNWPMLVNIGNASRSSAVA